MTHTFLTRPTRNKARNPDNQCSEHSAIPLAIGTSDAFPIAYRIEPACNAALCVFLDSTKIIRKQAHLVRKKFVYLTVFPEAVKILSF